MAKCISQLTVRDLQLWYPTNREANTLSIKRINSYGLSKFDLKKSLIMSDSAFDGKSLNFLNWFKALPGGSFHSDIEIQDLRANGRGRGISTYSSLVQT